MTKVLSIFSHKGGVGKTTVTVNLAAAFSLMLSHENPEKSKRVLLIDLDEQGHSATLLAKGFYGKKDEFEIDPFANIASLLMQTSDKPMDQIIQTSHIPIHGQSNLDYIPSNRALMTKVEVHLRNNPGDGLTRLENILVPILDTYEYIIIDNPPGMNLINLNGLVAATHVVGLTQLETPSINSLNNAIQTIENVQKKYNSDLKFIGILPNMCDFRMGEHSDFLAALKKHYKKYLLPPLSRRADITYATSRGLDIFSHKPPRSKKEFESKNNSVMEYAKLANELKKRMKR
ncbi:MAG: ParA family protein [Chloroflexi bacterium]|jgi:chromosome partitioning protein|nr:ParA family protein [Chloroflexota bacterium]MBT3668756.1 ParA family protein [Chloroflexota bacterium]MBT4001898.1 ParA family protein [Chloroflexota bacterium]MBT4305457.1 ParA family protein [Chloroflexota bacterium]MBT4533068.1 ParA family protein [Chloroflexota bacterium]